MVTRNPWTRQKNRRLSRRTLLQASARTGVGVAGLALIGCGDDDDDASEDASVDGPFVGRLAPRRVGTGIDADGKSYFVHDGETPGHLNDGFYVIDELWRDDPANPEIPERQRTPLRTPRASRLPGRSPGTVARSSAS